MIFLAHNLACNWLFYWIINWFETLWFLFTTCTFIRKKKKMTSHAVNSKTKQATNMNKWTEWWRRKSCMYVIAYHVYLVLIIIYYFLFCLVLQTICWIIPTSGFGFLLWEVMHKLFLGNTARGRWMSNCGHMDPFFGFSCVTQFSKYLHGCKSASLIQQNA